MFEKEIKNLLEKMARSLDADEILIISQTIENLVRSKCMLVAHSIKTENL